MRVSIQLAVMRVVCLSAVWQSTRALLTKRFELLLDGSTGELAGSYTTFQFTHIYSCGARCASESSCWAWSYDDISSVCHVFPSDAAADSTTGTSTSFRTYARPSLASLGYVVPTTRSRTWLDGFNSCNNNNGKMAYEPDMNVMKDILNELSATNILIGLERTSTGAQTWQDMDGNVVPYDSIKWEPGQPNNANGKEDACLCYNGVIADIDKDAVFSPSIPVLCKKKP